MDGSTLLVSRFVDASTPLAVKVHSLQNNRAYTVKVWAVHDRDGAPGAVATHTFSTQAEATAPEAPASVTFDSVSGGTVDVSWSKPLDTGGLPIRFYVVCMQSWVCAWCTKSVLTCVTVWP